MDVVPADARYWDVPPFDATITDGYLYGRGALDTKTLGILQLQAFLALHRDRVPLERDVLFVATADEEAGGAYGAGWLVAHRPEIFEGVGLVLNEGGGGSLANGRESFAIEVTQKVPLWLKLVSVGTPGHGSTPQVSSSVSRLIRALDRIQTYEFAPRVLPAVATYFKGLAVNATPDWQEPFANPVALAADRSLLLKLQIERPGLAALLRNTCSVTMLQGSSKINVVPPEAEAQVDCRLLPDQDPDAFVKELVGVVNDPGIRVETLMAFTPGVSPVDTPLYRAIEAAVRRHFPAATVMPSVMAGFTDSHFLRDLGIASYGFVPVVVPVGDDRGVHGNNERISIENVERGTRIMREIVRDVATTAR
jgi:acetylornithine deacetylase/succinyl-diaminopimelate desuccinylase-like protein